MSALLLCRIGGFHFDASISEFLTANKTEVLNNIRIL